MDIYWVLAVEAAVQCTGLAFQDAQVMWLPFGCGMQQLRKKDRSFPENIKHPLTLIQYRLLAGVWLSGRLTPFGDDLAVGQSREQRMQPLQVNATMAALKRKHANDCSSYL